MLIAGTIISMYMAVMVFAGEFSLGKVPPIILIAGKDLWDYIPVCAHGWNGICR